MQSLAQVWIIVLSPFLGLAIITGVVFGVLGAGQYRYDSNPINAFSNTTCYINSSQMLPFSRMKVVLGITKSCAPIASECWGVKWEV